LPPKRTILDDHPEESAAAMQRAYNLGAWHMLIWLAAWTAWANSLKR